MKIIVRFTKYSKHMFDANRIDYATDDTGEYSKSQKVIVYLDPLVTPIDLESQIKFDEVYALNEDGTRSFRKCVTLEDFYAFLEEETRYMKGSQSNENAEN